MVTSSCLVRRPRPTQRLRMAVATALVAALVLANGHVALANSVHARSAAAPPLNGASLRKLQVSASSGSGANGPAPAPRAPKPKFTLEYDPDAYVNVGTVAPDPEQTFFGLFPTKKVYLAVGMGFPAVFLAYKLFMACWFCTAGRAKFAREDRAHEEKMLLEREEMERAALAAQAQAQADQQLLLIQQQQQQQQQQQARGSVSAPMNMSSRSSKFWIDEELQAWRLDFQQLKLTKCLTVNTPKQNRHVPGTTTTTGPALGEVWLATYFAMDEENHQRQVALKWISPKLVNTEVQQEKLKEEIKRQAKLRHPNVAAFIGIAWSPETNLVAVTEYMPRGDLRQWLHRTAAKDAGRWTPAKVKMLLDIANALVYLHSFQPRLIHGNVNSRNVLLNDRMEAKLSDFGAPKDYLSEREINAYKEVGSGRWISPEALIGREGADHVNDATDVYSLGILMVEMDSHQLPFADLMQSDRSALPELDVLQLISNGALTPSLSSSCLPRIQSLVQACTAYDPQKRPSSRSIAKTLQAVLAEVSGKQQHGG